LRLADGWPRRQPFFSDAHCRIRGRSVKCEPCQRQESTFVVRVAGEGLKASTRWLGTQTLEGRPTSAGPVIVPIVTGRHQWAASHLRRSGDFGPPQHPRERPCPESVARRGGVLADIRRALFHSGSRAATSPVASRARYVAEDCGSSCTAPGRAARRRPRSSPRWAGPEAACRRHRGPLFASVAIRLLAAAETSRHQADFEVRRL
jgi:hypothetical protein